MEKRTFPLVLGQFLEGINQASGAARHMIHHHQDTRWFPICGILETIHRITVAQVVDPLLKPKPKLQQSTP